MKKLSKSNMALLATIVVATIHEGSESAYELVSEAKSKELVKAGLVEVNKAISSEDGKLFATRATQAGIDMFEGKEEDGETEAQASKPAFELEEGIALPAVRRGGRGAKLYPFDDMEVGHSFHVPVSEKKPNPWKSLASTVSSATSRYKDEDGNVTRKFVVRAVGAEDPKGPGARVFRVE